MISNTPNPSGSTVEPTVDFQDTERPGSLHPMHAVSRSTIAGMADLQVLLRRRLLFVALVFTAYNIITLGLMADAAIRSLSTVPHFYVYLATVLTALLICVPAAGLLASRVRLSLGQLRALELVLFGSVFVRYLIRQSLFLWPGDGFLREVGPWLASGDLLRAQERLNALVYEMFFPWALYIIAYGVLIPNTWRRCALVVTVLTLLPVCVWMAGCAANGLPSDKWFLGRVNGSFLMLAVAAALAIYGSYRITTLQNEAFKARRLGQYTLREQLGAGGMGEVYRADHQFLRRPCAIKLIRTERAGDPLLMQRFEREVQATATLTHPNSVQIFDYGRSDDGTFYYAMEYLVGLTIEQLVERHGPLPPARAVHFLRQICGALREAHSIGLIHRDLKPTNVMICTRGGIPDTAKLLDFGLVQPQGESLESSKLTVDGTVTGTPSYMSPEQAGGPQTLDGRSDIYSLGALAYFMLTGQPPFAGRSTVKVLAAHIYEKPETLSSHNPGVPADLESVVLRCLAKKSSERFPDAQSLETALADCQSADQWTEEDAARWWSSNETFDRTRPREQIGQG
ncbi:MAG: serine/threonine-protein kinase [Gemmataceae bacterium]